MTSKNFFSPLKLGSWNKFSQRVMFGIAASLLSIAYFFPATCSGFIFIGLTFLFYTVLRHQNSLGFWDGMIWGITFFSLHFIGISMVVWEHAAGNLKMLCPLFLILYFSLFAAAIFNLTVYFSRMLPKTNSWFCFCWLVGLYFYYEVINSYSLWIFGMNRGYPFASLLIPLANDSRWLWVIGYCGVCVATVYVLIISLISALLIFNFGKKTLVIEFLLIIPFLCIRWMPFMANRAPFYLDYFAYAQPTQEENYWDAAQKINSRIVRAIEKKSHANIVIMPESTYPYVLTQEIVELWSKNALAAGIKLIIGAHALCGESLNNSLFCIEEARIIHDYVKNAPMIFTEYIPFPWNNVLTCQNLFLKDKKEFPKTKKGAHCLINLEGVEFFPCICSELFFDVYPKTRECDAPWICLVNDSWFSASYMRELMLLYARLYAVKRDIEIMYISHYYGLGLGKRGEVWPL